MIPISIKKKYDLNSVKYYFQPFFNNVTLESLQTKYLLFLYYFKIIICTMYNNYIIYDRNDSDYFK